MSVDPVIATIIRFALGWLFLAAPAHKLRDMADFRSVLATYRILPERLVAVAAWLVVVVEVAIGLGMLWQFTPAFVVGAALLLVYAGVMAINLLRGRRFIDCGCGGATQPLSIGLVLRNLVLAIAAITALAPSPARRSAGSTSSAWSPACWCSARYMRQRINCSPLGRASKSGCDGRTDRFEYRALASGHRTCVRRVRSHPSDRRAARARLAAGALTLSGGVKSGETPPALSLTGLDDSVLKLDSFAARGRGVLLFFLSPTCPLCRSLLPVVTRIAKEERKWLDLVFASDGGTRAEHEAYVKERQIEAFPYVISQELGVAFRVGKLPYAALLDEKGVLVAKGLVNSREHLESPVRSETAGSGERQRIHGRQGAR
jgi:methylamine dehydrogenase accessory protein MauD